MKKIIWAVDAFQEDAKLNSRVAEVLGQISEPLKSRVEPVYVLSPEQLNLNIELSTPWVTEYKPAAEKAIGYAVRKMKVPGMGSPKVLVHKIPSVTSATRALSDYAEKSRADLIVVGTHARKGLARFFLGSFTENLLLHSNVPVLVVGPSTKKLRGCDHILFSTDFSRGSRAAFDRVISLAKGLGARVTVFNHVQNPIEPIVQSGVYLLGGGWVSVSAYMEEEAAKQREHAKAWVAAAKKAGVQADFVVESGRETVTESILDAAHDKRSCLIAMAGQSGAVAAALVGSIARQVVRSADVPVWVVHAPKKRR